MGGQSADGHLCRRIKAKPPQLLCQTYPLRGSVTRLNHQGNQRLSPDFLLLRAVFFFAPVFFATLRLVFLRAIVLCFVAVDFFFFAIARYLVVGKNKARKLRRTAFDADVIIGK